jgi:UDP-glucose 4-epimerase/UDP-arabinose 4-epimerase
MTSRAVLVTGGAGYIGAHTCKALAAQGYMPVTFDNLSTGHRDFVKWGPLVIGEIIDADAVASALHRYDVSAVIHFAAHANIGESVSEPREYYENNVAGSLSLLRGMARAGVDKFIFSSTCAIYGQPEHVPVAESERPRPITPYGVSKLMVEQIATDFRSAYDLAFTALRYFNASGADPDCELGELRDPETHLIPRAMMALQGHIDDFQVFGTDFPTPDGTAVRDYIHVSDLADAHVLAVADLLDGGQGDVFNLGAGKGHSVKQVLDAIATETGLPLPAPSGPKREGDAASLFADATLARQRLGWRPKASDLSTIVGSAWRWHRKAHPKRNRPG